MIKNEKLFEIISGDYLTKKIDGNSFHNAKLLLKIYKDVVWRIEERVYDFDAECHELSGKHLDGLIDCLIDSDTLIDKKIFESKLRSLHTSKTIIDIVNKCLSMIKNYPEYGEVYYFILYSQYIAKGVAAKEKTMLDKLNMEKTTFYRRKKEAINLFGVILWGYMLPSLANVVVHEYIKPESNFVGTVLEQI